MRVNPLRITCFCLATWLAIAGGLTANEMCRAAERANSDTLVVQIALHPENVNRLDENGELPLVVAVRFQREENVKLLLQAGADIHTENWQGESPLAAAIQQGSLSMVELLLKHGADPKRAFTRGGRALDLALTQSQWAIAVKLLDAGAPLNDSPGLGNSPLCFAVFAWLTQKAPVIIPVIESMLQHGADVSALSQGKYMLDFSLCGINHPLAHLLIDQMWKAGWRPGTPLPNFHLPGVDPWVTLLFSAIENGDLTQIRFLLAHGWSVDHPNSLGATPLMAALHTQQGVPDRVIRLLLEFHPDLTIAEPTNGETVLTLAVRDDLVDEVHLLLDAGADINQRRVIPQNQSQAGRQDELDAWALPPIRMAKSAAMVDVLVAHGAQPELESLRDSNIAPQPRAAQQAIYRHLVFVNPYGWLVFWALALAIAWASLLFVRRRKSLSAPGGDSAVESKQQITDKQGWSKVQVTQPELWRFGQRPPTKNAALWPRRMQTAQRAGVISLAAVGLTWLFFFIDPILRALPMGMHLGMLFSLIALAASQALMISRHLRLRSELVTLVLMAVTAAVGLHYFPFQAAWEFNSPPLVLIVVINAILTATHLIGWSVMLRGSSILKERLPQRGSALDARTELEVDNRWDEQD